MKRKKGQGYILLLLLLLPPLLYVVLTTGKHNMLDLPFFGPKEVVTKTVNGEEVTDTVYYAIPEFSFTDQNGNAFTRETLKGKIALVSFFTPEGSDKVARMALQMTNIQDDNKNAKDVVLISFVPGLKPDDQEGLQRLMETLSVKPDKWYFIAGSNQELLEFARDGLLIFSENDLEVPELFDFSPIFTLVDSKGRIRGYYDGVQYTEGKEVMEGVRALKAKKFIDERERKSI